MTWNIDDLSAEDKQRLVRFLQPYFHTRAPDSTENAGKYGVRSLEPGKTAETDGYVLTADGAGGSTWRPSNATSFSTTLLGIAADHPGHLLGYWRLGEDPGDPWADSSGLSPPSPLSKVSGTNALTPGVTGALSATQDDGALQFDGRSNVTTGDYVHTTANGSRFSLNNTAMSVACWVKPVHDASGSYMGVIGVFIAGTSTSRGWGIHILQSTLAPSFDRFQDGGTQKSVIGTALADNEWAFLVGTYDPAVGAKIYVNGALSASDATTFNLTGADTNGVTIGWLRSSSAFDAYLEGTVDEASVWSIALSADEVLQLYNASGVAATLATPSGPGGGVLGGSYPDPTFASTVAGSGLAIDGTDSVLSVNVDNSTIEISTDTLRVKDAGISTAKIADSAVTSAKIADGTIAEGDLGLSDVTTANSSTSKHGFLKKLDNNSTHYMDGTGAWSTPPGDPSSQTQTWMPLFDADGALVLDGDGNLIPTLIPI